MLYSMTWLSIILHLHLCCRSPFVLVVNVKKQVTVTLTTKTNGIILTYILEPEYRM